MFPKNDDEMLTTLQQSAMQAHGIELKNRLENKINPAGSASHGADMSGPQAQPQAPNPPAAAPAPMIMQRSPRPAASSGLAVGRGTRPPFFGRAQLAARLAAELAAQ